MTKQRWDEMKVILAAALELDPSSRNSYVHSAAGSDTELLSELIRILDQDSGNSGFLSRPAFQGARPLPNVREPLFATGNVIAGRFRIVRFIACGGMGEVYEAEDLQLGGRLALKSFYRQTIFDIDVSRFCAGEIQLARRVTHPNVCRIFDLVQHADPESGEPIMLMSMELLEGRTLAGHLQEKGPFRYSEAVEWITQIAQGLQAAHDAGIIHGDLKPANIMLSPGSGNTPQRAVLMDFSIALPADPEARIADFLRAGTPDYIAPEQANAGPLTPAADMYSFALLILAMLGLSRTPDLHSGIGEQKIPVEAARALERCLDPDPSQRILRPLDLSRIMSQPPLRKRLPALAAIVTVTLLVVFALVYLVSKKSNQGIAGAGFPGISQEPLTALPGDEIGAAFSPDGSQVAFHWRRHAGESGIYRKSIGSEATTLIVPESADEGFAYSPAWSPDGRTIAFLCRNVRRETWLWSVAATGGETRRIRRLARPYPESVGMNLLLGNEQHIAWTRDGDRLYVPMSDSLELTGIYRLSMRTGEIERITKPPGQARDIAPALSPEGRKLAFIRAWNQPQNTNSELFIQKLNADGAGEGDAELLFRFGGIPEGMAWTPSTGEIILCSGPPRPPGENQIRFWRIKAEPGATATTIEGDPCSGIAVSRPDASGVAQLAFGSPSRGKSNLWQVKVSELDRPRPFAPSTRFESYPQFSPNGERVAFASTRSGSLEVWTTRSDGTDPIRLTSHSGIRGGPHWTPTGDRIVFATGKGFAEVRGGDQIVEPLALAAPNNASEPIWSQDGESLLYKAGRQIWQYRKGAATPNLVTTVPNNPHFLTAGPDGKSLFYTHSYGQFVLSRLSVLSGEQIALQEGVRRSFAVTKRWIYFIATSDTNLYRMPVSGGPAVRLGVFPGISTKVRYDMPGMTVSSDDSRLIYGLTEDEGQDLILIKSFR